MRTIPVAGVRPLLSDGERSYRVRPLLPSIGGLGLAMTCFFAWRLFRALWAEFPPTRSGEDVLQHDVIPVVVGLGLPSICLLWMLRLRAVICDWGICYRGVFRSVRVPWTSIIDVRRDAKGLTFKVNCGGRWVSLVNLSSQGQDLDEAIIATLKAMAGG